MTTVWNTLKKYASQLGITYNAVGKKYNQANYTYNGKLGTVWRSQTPKH